LDTETEAEATVPGKQFGSHKKATLLTRRHIIKGSSRKLPFAALNEYLCMQVLARVLPGARAEVSRDGNAQVVDRFDVDEQGQLLWGMEDFCALRQSTRLPGNASRAQYKTMCLESGSTKPSGIWRRRYC
jgi:HipA-like C-terminal domain